MSFRSIERYSLFCFFVSSASGEFKWSKKNVFKLLLSKNSIYLPPQQNRTCLSEECFIASLNSNFASFWDKEIYKVKKKKRLLTMEMNLLQNSLLLISSHIPILLWSNQACLFLLLLGSRSLVLTFWRQAKVTGSSKYLVEMFFVFMCKHRQKKN